MKILAPIIIITLTMLNIIVYADDETNVLTPFPIAHANAERFVITLPSLDEQLEQNAMVEIIVGKNMLTDGVNKIQLASTIETKNLDGWGYNYYEVQDSPLSLSTMMAAPENTEKMIRFVTTPSIKVRYNSRLPIVVYVPQGYQVQYKLWQATNETLSAEIK